MQGGGEREKPVPVDCISLLNLNWLISSPIWHMCPNVQDVWLF